MAGCSPGRFPAAGRPIIFFYLEPEIRILTTHFIDDGKCGLGSGNLQTIVRVWPGSVSPGVTIVSCHGEESCQPAQHRNHVTGNQAPGQARQEMSAFKREIIKVGV